MTTTTRLAAVLVCALVAGGCSGKGGAPKADPKATADELAKAEGLEKEEGDVLERRDELQRERKQIHDDREKLVEKRKQLAAAGADTSAVDKEEADLSTRETALVDQESALNKRLEGLIGQYQQQLAGKGGGEDVARREAALALREKDVARREEKIASRESDLAVREKSQAQREKETCGTGTTTIVQQVEPTKGSKYTKHDVEPVLQKARKKMSDKGLLSSDLPSPAQELEQESVSAMKDGDFGKAKFAADQLYATVDSMKIDKGFISAKINRLNTLYKTKPLDPSKKKDVDDLFRGATSDYGDGHFPAANAKLNKIYAIIR